MNDLKTGSSAAHIAHLIGLPQTDTISDLDLADLIAAGLSVSAVKSLAKGMDPSGRYVRDTDIIAESDLVEYRRSRRKLSVFHGNTLYSLAVTYSECCRVFGSDDKALRFMLRPHPMLNSATPFCLAKSSSAGTVAVRQLLGRIDAGVAA